MADLRAAHEAIRTALFGSLLAEATDDVQQLDAIMNNKCARQPDKLRAWQSASRVERAPQREKKPASPAPALPKP